MKPDVTTPEATATPVAARTPTKLGDVLMLAKVRVNALVVATTAGGYYMASPPNVSLVSLGLTCLGTALVASGAAALNQVHERDTDALMRRTRHRPVAAGRMGPGEGNLIGALLSAAGLGLLWWAANGTAALVALATLISYAAVYTPLKRRTSLATVIGAVPGALPPLIGWAAVTGSVGGIEPWTLFLIMFFWQLPHFLAIAWVFRDDYARAGLPMLSVIDTDGAFTGRQATLWAAALVPFSQLPFLFGVTSSTYALGALFLGLAHLWAAFQFARRRNVATARILFYGSIIYLPLLWALMVIGRR